MSPATPSDDPDESQSREPADDTPDAPDEWSRTLTRARRRLDHAAAAVETVADHTDDEADDAALRRALNVLTNVEGDLEELDALAADELSNATDG